MQFLKQIVLKLTYRLASATISGNVGGKALHVTMRLLQTGPPAGNYDIHPPVNDPIYGLVALMTPSTFSPGGAASHASKIESGGGMAEAYKAFSSPQAAIFIKVEGGMALYGKVFPKTQGGMASTGQVFVLSSRPILGQNSLVVSHGFADLMDALQAAGGASVALS